MPSLYPGALDDLPEIASGTGQKMDGSGTPPGGPVASALLNGIVQAVEATQATLGVNPQGGSATVAARVAAAEAAIAGKENAGAAAAAVSAHVAAGDPHPQYETAVEAQAKVDAHANLTNNPHGVTAAQVGAESSGAVAAHAALAAPHSGHATTAALGAHVGDTANPHATTAAQVGADATGTAAAAVASHSAATSGVHGISAFGATLVDDVDAATALATLGTDAAGTARPPNGSASGDLTGTYPSPTVANGAITGAKLATNTKRRVISFNVTSSTAVSTGGKDKKAIVPYNGTIIGWRLSADQATTATLDVWKANNANPTNANTITASAKPTLTAATQANSTTLTGWTTAIAEGDILMFEVEANSAALTLDLILVVEVS